MIKIPMQNCGSSQLRQLVEFRANCTTLKPKLFGIVAEVRKRATSLRNMEP